MRIVDLSALIEPSQPDAPVFARTGVKYTDHAGGAAQIEALFKVPRELLRAGEGWAIEELHDFGTHNSTHVDAPYHYNSQIGGVPAQTIDQLPLEHFFGEGVVLDMRQKADGDAMTRADAQAELARIGYTLKSADIVLVRTGRDAFYGQPDYVFRGCGVTAEATHWLYDQGVRVMGIDAWGWDAPLDRQAREALTRREPGIFWAAHQADLPYMQIERLCNLGALPSFGFTVACFPLKIKGASAAPCRAVAIVPE
jgi:kynurenine formamidase